MPAKLLKKICPVCNTNFFTYDADMEFCCTDHKGKFEYSKLFYCKIDPKEEYCLACGELTNKKFCTSQCQKSYRNAENREDTLKRSKEMFVNKKKGKPVPYSVLNKMEEKKRVFDDSWWRYSVNRNKI